MVCLHRSSVFFSSLAYAWHKWSANTCLWISQKWASAGNTILRNWQKRGSLSLSCRIYTLFFFFFFDVDPLIYIYKENKSWATDVQQSWTSELEKRKRQAIKVITRKSRKKKKEDSRQGCHFTTYAFPYFFFFFQQPLEAKMPLKNMVWKVSFYKSVLLVVSPTCTVITLHKYVKRDRKQQRRSEKSTRNSHSRDVNRDIRIRKHQGQIGKKKRYTFRRQTNKRRSTKTVCDAMDKKYVLDVKKKKREERKVCRRRRKREETCEKDQQKVKSKRQSRRGCENGWRYVSES